MWDKIGKNISGKISDPCRLGWDDLNKSKA